MSIHHRFALALALSLGFAATSSLRAGSCCADCAAPAQKSTLPETSLYNATGSWRDQNGRTVTLAGFAGSPVVVTMVFTHCAYACPRIVGDLRAIREAMPADVREKTRFVLASFDTERDTPARLREWAAEQNLDAKHWKLLHGDVNAVRELAVLLDIAYVRQPDGNYAHGNRIVLLDARGVARASIEGLGAKPALIANAATALAASAR